jgi:hypothetical protein
MARVVQEYGTVSSSGAFCLDFSVIPSAKFHLLFEDLKKFGPKKRFALNLNCNTRVDFIREFIETKKDETISYPEIIRQSIDLKKNQDYGECVVSFLIELFTRNRHLNALTVSGIDIDIGQVSRLLSALPACRSLQSLYLSDLKIGDSELRRLLRAELRGPLLHIGFSDCEITDASLRAILEYTAKAKIQSFQIHDDGFSHESEQAIAKALNAKRAKKEAEEKLRLENEELRRKIGYLKNLNNGIKCPDGTYVIGPGAERFHQHLQELVQSQAKGLTRKKKS